jgi:hypothetical protein
METRILNSKTNLVTIQNNNPIKPISKSVIKANPSMVEEYEEIMQTIDQSII